MRRPFPVLWVRKILWGVIGGGIFVWIGYEDRTTVIPVSLGGLIALALALQLGPGRIPSRVAGSYRSAAAAILIGLIAGSIAMPLAALSMLVKISLHSHVPPDFSLTQVLAVLERTPVWSGAGVLVGLAVAVARGREQES